MGNQEQWLSVLRTALKIGGGLAVAHGVGDAAGWANIANDAVTLAGAIAAIWAVVSSWKKHA